MSTDQIYATLSEIMQDVFDDDDIVAKPELTAKDVEGWDSLSNLRFILSVEKEFGVKFTAAEIGKLANVGELAAMIAARA